MEQISRLFNGFDGREEDLKKIERYGMHKPMLYRTDLLTHSIRVSAIVRELLPYAYRAFRLKSFNGDRAFTLALVHDDAEILTGDIQLYHKLRMSKEELNKIKEDERKAIEELYTRFGMPRVNGFDYRALLLHSLNKDCLEAQLVSFADKMDAFCESLHELFAGNSRFLRVVASYISILHGFEDKFQELSDIFYENGLEKVHTFLMGMGDIDLDSIASNGKPHDRESIKNSTGVIQYDFWKELTLREFGDRGIELLTEKRE